MTRRCRFMESDVDAPEQLERIKQQVRPNKSICRATIADTSPNPLCSALAIGAERCKTARRADVLEAVTADEFMQAPRMCLITRGCCTGWADARR